jgi:thiol-disulfide isomerase/thioredoxin
MWWQLKHVWLGVLALAVVACTPASGGVNMSQFMASETSTLQDLGPAPELENTIWLNTDSTLRLSDLRGKVVGLEMWTFGCINCRNVIPALNRWHADYKDQGFVLIANHFPEFDFEGDLGNLQRAVAEAGIEYAVAQDNDGSTWNAYRNHYWPTLYLIDKRGRIRYVHIGEGAYEETERNIRALLAESYP